MDEKQLIDEELYKRSLHKKIEDEYGRETLDAVLAHIAIYDERFYLWLADLYDPGEYGEDGTPLGGGFYYSNSARDNEGYNIDIESTQQVLSFLSSSGMIKNFEGGYMEAIPEKVRRETVAFAKSLQSPEDGYFYHPQWGKDIYIARLSRDLGWSTTLLAQFGEKPYWDAPNGVAGSLGAPSIDKMAESATASEKYVEQLRSIDAWVEYLESKRTEMKTKSYPIGHEIVSQVRQVIAREKIAVERGELGTDGRPIADYDGDGVADNGFAMYVKKFFDSTQNVENGVWEENNSYNAVNGLMKIMFAYEQLGLSFNLADRAVKCAIDIILLDSEDVNGKIANNSTDVYNPWIAITRILDVVRKSNKDPALAASLKATVKENATDMVRVTTAKTLKFKKDDGSFGYTHSYSPAQSQKAPAAVPYTVEGDVNGGVIAVTGVTRNMLNALGIDMPIYYRSDYEKFIERLLGRKHIKK